MLWVGVVQCTRWSFSPEKRELLADFENKCTQMHKFYEETGNKNAQSVVNHTLQRGQTQALFSAE